MNFINETFTIQFMSNLGVNCQFSTPVNDFAIAIMRIIARLSPKINFSLPNDWGNVLIVFCNVAKLKLKSNFLCFHKLMYELEDVIAV